MEKILTATKWLIPVLAVFLTGAESTNEEKVLRFFVLGKLAAGESEHTYISDHGHWSTFEITKERDDDPSMWTAIVWGNVNKTLYQGVSYTCSTLKIDGSSEERGFKAHILDTSDSSQVRWLLETVESWVQVDMLSISTFSGGDWGLIAKDDYKPILVDMANGSRLKIWVRDRFSVHHIDVPTNGFQEAYKWVIAQCQEGNERLLEKIMSMPVK